MKPFKFVRTSPREGVLIFTLFDKDGLPASHYETLQILTQFEEGKTLRKLFRDTLLAQELDTYFWETPGVTAEYAKDHQFEFALIAAPLLPNMETSSSNIYKIRIFWGSAYTH